MWGIPDNCKIGNTVFKKHFYDNASLSPKDKDLFASVINKIQWQYCLKPEAINIKAYKDEIRDYSEIEIIEVFVEADTKLRRIAEIIMKTIPYPMVLIFTLNGQKQIWTAYQRVNQNDPSKNTIEDFIYTDWISSDYKLFENLDITKMNMTNFYTLYSSFVDIISKHNARAITNKDITGKQARELTAKIEELEGQISSLKVKLKKETQFNKRIEINIEIKNLEKREKDIYEKN